MKKFQPFLTITPLGGVNEIGSNSCLIQTQSRSIMIDVGIGFPKPKHLGANYLIPHYHCFKGPPLTHLVLTHGHEDHIGAIKFFLREFPQVEIYGPPLAIELIRLKLGDFAKNFRLHTYLGPGPILNWPELSIEAYPVHHSIPQTYGLALIKEKFCSFYLSDFKSDLNDPYEDFSMHKALRELKDRFTTRLLLADSTNAHLNSRTISESELIGPLKKIISSSNQGIFATFFPSNLYRMKTFFDLAHQHQREVILMGGSMKRMHKVACQLNILDLAHHPVKVIDDSILPQFNGKNSVVLLSGSQGDYRGAFKRIARDEHKVIKITEKDTFIFSSRPIPGNTTQVYDLLNDLADRDVIIHTAQDSLIHASGHAAREDLSDVYHSFAPTHAAPIHGESFLLQRHLQFVRESFPQVECFPLRNLHHLQVIEEGQILHHKHPPGNERPENQIKMEAMRFAFNENYLVDYEVISQRIKMAQKGLVVIALPTGRKGQAQVDLLGIGPIAPLQKQKLRQLIQSFPHFSGEIGAHQEQELRRVTRKFIKEITGLTPMICIMDSITSPANT